MKRFAIGVLKALGVVVALYLVARAIAEPFLIDVTDPSTYRDDWGGPALAGVLAVHVGPGILAALALFGSVRRRLAGRPSARRRSVAGAAAPTTPDPGSNRR